MIQAFTEEEGRASSPKGMGRVSPQATQLAPGEFHQAGGSLSKEHTLLIMPVSVRSGDLGVPVRGELDPCT